MILAALTTVEDWVAVLTPIAVAISIVYQKTQSTKVKAALEDATVVSNDKLDKIHGIVNGNMTEQKRIAMNQAQRIADLTKSPADIAVAIDAKRIYDDHIARSQLTVAEQILSQHRVLVSDGPAIKMILVRLENIENRLKVVKCVQGDECPLAEPETKPDSLNPDKSVA